MAFAFNDNGSKANISIRSADFDQQHANSCIEIQSAFVTTYSTMKISVRNNVVQVYLPLEDTRGRWSYDQHAGTHPVKFKSPYTPTQNYAVLRVRGLNEAGKNYKEIGSLWVQSDGNSTLYLDGDFNYQRIYIEGTYIIN